MTTELAATTRSSLRSRINEFFFAEEIPYGLAILRMCLPVAILADMVPRWAWVRELYSTDGTPMPLSASYGAAPLFPAFPPVVAIALHTALLFALVAVFIGWQTRVSLAFSFVVYTAFCLLDSVSTMTKYTVIASHILLLLSLSECGAIWSIDSLIKRRWQRAEGMSADDMLAARRSPICTRRLVQLLIGFVYFGAAFTKIHTPAFFTGDQMYHWLMTDYNSDHPLGQWMSMFPWFLVFSSYLTVVWEILFVFLAWKGWGRVFSLGLGALFHIGTLLLIGLWIFPMVCIPIYFAFFSEQEYKTFFAAIKRWREKSTVLNRIVSTIARFSVRIPLPENAGAYSAPLYFAVALAIAGSGVGLERWMDPYGERRAEGPYTLSELDPEFVEGTLFGKIEPMRDVDKFNALSLGTLTIGGVVADARTDFHQGDNVIAQVILVPPHEDLWVDFGLYDDKDHPIDIVGNAVLHDTLRVETMFMLPSSLEPGDYSIIIKSAGKEVLRRKFTLHAGKHIASPLAN